MTRRWLIVAAIALVACNKERHRLTERLTALEQQRADAVRRINDRRGVVADAENRLASLNTELTAYNTEVHAFIDNHKVAAACIHASRANWINDDHGVADEASAASRIGGALCGVALLSSDFAQEVELVTARLAEADARVKGLNEQIGSIRKTIDLERSKIDQDQAELDQLAAEMANARAQLGD